MRLQVTVSTARATEHQPQWTEYHSLVESNGLVALHHSRCQQTTQAMRCTRVFWRANATIHSLMYLINWLSTGRTAALAATAASR